MCGGGTSIDVAAQTGRRGIGFDVSPYRPDIRRADARKLPLEDGVADLVFVDPPYADNIKYSNAPGSIDRFPARDERYYEALDAVSAECRRILRKGGVLGALVCDHHVKKEGFTPIGFRTFGILSRRFEPLDVVAVVRHNRTLDQGNYHEAAREGNFFLRGFNYLFIVRAA
jgi:DNA modification methylase